MTGHTAGKSTLCRLLRYLLGEHGFAPERARKRIRTKLSTAWIVGEIFVEGNLWTVARPLGLGPHSFCVQGSSIQQVLNDHGARGEYRAFLDALERATVEPLLARNYPSNDEPVAWEHLLPWLSRDQECRFADLLEWRHSSSESDSPSLRADARNFLVRSVLGLISDAERAEQLHNARLVLRKKDAGRDAPLLSHQATADHHRVQRMLGTSLAPPSSDLFGSEANAEVHRQRAVVEAELAALAAAHPQDALQATLETAVAVEANARRDCKDADDRLAHENRILEQLKKPDHTLPPLLGEFGAARGFCNVPMESARRSGCPLAGSLPSELASRRSERTSEAEIVDRQRVVDALTIVAMQKETALAAAVETTKLARRQSIESATKHEEQREPLRERRAQLAQAERFVREAEEAWKKAADLASSIEALEVDITDSYAKQDQLRRASDEALQRFSSTYDYVVRAILGEEITAKVDSSGRSLSLVVEHHGERESAAFATLKLLAFDLAALTDSVEGRGNFPRFLLHDGPREADLAPEIYERIFLYVQQLESCFVADPSFQYIITTTTQPPASLLGEPWLRLKLSGIPAEDRLLGCDL